MLVGISLALSAAAPSTTPANLFGIPGLTFTGAGTWTGVAMFTIYLFREWRETRKLSADDRMARREGYAKQVEGLMGENRKLRNDLADAETRHDSYRRACQAETDQLRDEIRGLEDKYLGLQRTISAQAGAMGRALIDGVKTPATAARMAKKGMEQ